MIDNSEVHLIINIKQQKRFYRILKRVKKFSKKYSTYMAIDFEFNTKKVALMQIAFEIQIIKFDAIKHLHKYYILDPNLLSSKILNYMKYNLISNSNIIKILHGAESLDMLYLIQTLFDLSESEKLIDFFKSMIDTKYLCEYMNLINNKPNICRIYEMLFNYDIITNHEKNMLNLNENNMQPIHLTIININNISSELITYAIHDVVYLVKVFEKLRLCIIKKSALHYYLLLDCFRFSLMEKQLVTNVNDYVIILNQMNNYFYISHINQKINLIQAYKLCMTEYLSSYDFDNLLFQIHYLKSDLSNLFKLVIYQIIINKYDVYMSNNLKITYTLDKHISDVKLSLKILEFNYLLELIEKFQKYTSEVF